MAYRNTKTRQSAAVKQPGDNSGGGGADARLAALLVACLRPLGGVHARPLGASHGIFHAAVLPDVPLGVVWGGGVYFKAGPDGVTRYIARGMRPLRPGPRQPLAGYWRVPDDVVAEPAALCAWAGHALDAALRFGKRRRTARRRRRPSAPPRECGGGE